MKYAIITSTYINHFQFIDKYLTSFIKFVEDKQDIPIFFTISKNEEKKFNKIVKKYKRYIDIRILFIEDLFEKNNIKETPDEFLEEYGRFTFQTAKKFYSMLSVDAEKFLVLDCESMWINKTNMTQLFENYFNSPFVMYSNIDKEYRNNSFFNIMLDNIKHLTGIENKWFIEHFMWYYEKNILQDMFDEIGSLYDMITILRKINTNGDFDNNSKVGIFEIVLYYAYLFKEQNRYNYKSIDIDQVLTQTIPEGILHNYKQDFYEFGKGSCGLIEHVLMLLNEQNADYFAQVFKKLHLNIIRCDNSSLKNVSLQEKFIDIVKPNILAASQEHAFGINNKYETLVLRNKYYWKMQTHICKLIHPKKFTFDLFIEPISIVLYAIKCFLKSMKSWKEYKSIYSNTKSFF